MKDTPRIQKTNAAMLKCMDFFVICLYISMTLINAIDLIFMKNMFL